MKSTALGGAALVIATEHPAVLASTPKAGNATMMGVPFETKDRVRLESSAWADAVRVC